MKLSQKNRPVTPQRIAACVSVAAVLAVFAAVVYFICGPMEGYLHSDFTDTIYWANASVESGKLFDGNFRYAALLPFSANLWFIPLIAVFGVSMTSQIIGMMIFALLFVGSVCFMCRSLKWSIPWTATLIVSILMIMSLSEKLREIMWGHVIYYSLILVLLFVGIGLAVRLLGARPGKNKRYILLLTSTGIWFLLTATNGVQIFAMVVLPVALGLFADMFFDGESRFADEKNRSPLFVATGVLLSGALGLALLSVLKGNIVADYADGHLVLTPVAYWTDHLLLLPQSWFELIGFDEVYTGLGTLPAMAVAAVGVVIAVMPLILLINYKKIEDVGTRLILLSHLAVSLVTLGGWICGNLSGATWRLTAMMGTAIAATVAAARHFVKERRSSPKEIVLGRVSALALAVMLIVSVIGSATILKMPADYGRNNVPHRLVAKLKAEGLEYGYATFWLSQTITLLSDSEIKTRMVLADEFDGVYTDYYQSSRLWYEDQEGVDRYFLLLEEYEAGDALRNEKFAEYVEEKDPEIITFENYFIFVFDENVEIKEET